MLEPACGLGAPAPVVRLVEWSVGLHRRWLFVSCSTNYLLLVHSFYYDHDSFIV